jgi:hypothetical protein
MPRPEEPSTHVPDSGGLGCLVRFAWVIVGHAAILLSLVWLFQNKPAGFTIVDLIFWGAVAFCIGLRFIDVSRLKGLTATGQPASMTDWRRYALIIGVGALVLWSAVHGAAYFRHG